jgi:cell division protein ZapA
VNRAAADQPPIVSTESPETSDARAPGKRATKAVGKPAVAIKLAGKEYRIRSDASEEWLQQVAGHVDQAMQNIRERTDTVDSLDIALLTALNLAREVLNLRSQLMGDELMHDASETRLRDLIEQVELELLPVSNADV